MKENHENREEVVDLFDAIFHKTNTYNELPEIFEQLGYEVSRSSFDGLKEYSLIYHLSGLSNTLMGILKAIRQLEDEAKILDIDLESEMDEDDYKLYEKLSGLLVVLEKS